MPMHQSNTDVPICGCERPLEANEQVQNACEATRNQLESDSVVNVASIVGRSGFPKMLTEFRNLVIEIIMK